MTDELIMMPISLECVSFLCCCAAGAALAVLFSLMFAAEKAFSFTAAATAVFDFLFCLICFETAFWLLMRYCSGAVRGYLLIGMALGAVICFCLLGEYVEKAFFALFVFVKEGICGLLRIVFIPILYAVKAGRRIVKKLFEVFYEIAKKVWRNRKFCLKKRAE